MDKLRRIFAVAGVIILLGMYLLTFISAMLATPSTHALFLGSLAATIIIPIFLYAYTLIYKMLYKKKDRNIEKEVQDKEA